MVNDNKLPEGRKALTDGEVFRSMQLVDITLETDEIGIWLLVGNQQAGHVSWYEITRRIEQKLLQEKFLLALAKLDEEDDLL